MQMVLDFEFDGGPLHGRRMMGPSGIRALHFLGFDAERGLLLTMTYDPSTVLGTYVAHERYVCPRTSDEVLVMRWQPAAERRSALRAS